MHHACPFCGKSDLVMTEDRAGIIERVMYWIRCRACGSQGPWKTTRAAAISWWDARCESKKTATIAEETDS